VPTSPYLECQPASQRVNERERAECWKGGRKKNLSGSHRASASLSCSLAMAPLMSLNYLFIRNRNIP
jgi:hypothetical protein